jgi:ATP-binding cassette subfamily B protein
MRSTSRKVKQTTAGINADIESTISGMRTAKAFSNENAEQEKFLGANERFKRSKSDYYKAMGRFNGSMEFFLCILPVTVIAVGGYLMMRGEMNYIDLITFSLYTSTFINPMRRLSNLSEMLVNGLAGLGRFAELMRLEPELEDKPGAPELRDVKGKIDVEDVSFSYDKDEEVLHHVSLHVSPGETVAIVGPSGGGKSTLCSLIPRFYDVKEGSISIDGQDVRDVQQRSLRRNIGVVQQEVFLFADSILENIRYGRPGASTDEVIEAARRAEIYDDIMAMPEGFDTYVGERGALLSGGQKQRISIARIFLKDPPILILDEATSALDSITESKIQRSFDDLSQGRTTLIIAHRLSTVRAAHRILVIRDGIIAEEGTHEALLAKNGDYARLYHTQNLDEQRSASKENL